MRRLRRSRNDKIPENFRGAKRIEKMVDLLKVQRSIMLDSSIKHKFPSNWSPTKEQLLRESKDKCGYCESPTSVISYGDVEHYRPKSVYWWLAYCYDNYVASCTLCNQKYKKAKFETLNGRMVGPPVNAGDSLASLTAIAAMVIPDPLIEAEGMSYKDFKKAHDQERPLLLNPYLDDPKKFFAWEVDHAKGYVKLIPLDASNNLHIKVLEATEKDIGINRKELCQHRYDTYLAYATARLTSEDPGTAAFVKAQNLNLKKRLLRTSSAYTGMLRYFEKVTTDQLPLPSV